MAIRFELFLFLVLALPPALAQTCFFQYQSTKATALQPCLGTVSKGGQGVACCGSGSYCLDNGVCFDPKALSLYRGGCTDATWVSNNCANYCDKYGISVSELWPCGNNEFACDPNSCNASFAVPEGTLVVNQALSSALSLTPATATATATSRTTTTVTVTPAATTVAAKGTVSVGGAAAIGAGIGAPLLIALIAALVLLFREHKKRSAGSPAAPYVYQGTPELAGYQQVAQPGYYNKTGNVHQRGPEYGNTYQNQEPSNELESASSGARYAYDPAPR